MSLKGWLALRIFDRVAGGDTVYDQWGHAPTKLQTVWRKASNVCTRIVADDAAQFIYQSGRSDWSITDGSFGVLRPPFEDLWIEWQTPSARYFQGNWHHMARTRIATHISRDDSSLFVEVVGSHDTAPIGMWALSVTIENPSDINGLDWRIDVYPEMDAMFDARHPDFTHQEYAAGLAIELWPAWLTLGWMNCRNSGLETVTPPNRILRKRVRRGQPLGLDYKRIVIEEATRKALARNRESTISSQRLHIVRGHMKHYTAERPLFGKLTGNYWWHQQMRGDAALGRINHEYHVQARGSE